MTGNTSGNVVSALRRLVLVGCALGSLGVITLATLSVIGEIGSTTARHTVSFAADGITLVDIVTTSGSVVVEGTGTDRVEGQRRAHYALARPKFDERVEGTTLVLDARCTAVAFGPCEVDYTLTVPRDVAVRVRTSAGSVVASDLDAGVNLRSSGGSVRAERITGEVVMRTDAGTVRGRDLRSPVVDAKTSAGTVDLELMIAPQRVRASSSAGSVTVVVPDDATAYAVDASSDAGDAAVRVRTDPASAHTIDASTSAGNVTVRYPEG